MQNLLKPTWKEITKKKLNEFDIEEMLGFGNYPPHVRDILNENEFQALIDAEDHAFLEMAAMATQDIPEEAFGMLENNRE